MKTKTSTVAENVRLKQWSELIRECQNRPAEQSMDDWCKQQGISKTNYYYRLRRVRQAILNHSEKEMVPCQSTQSFVELPVPSTDIPVAVSMEHTKSAAPVASAVIHGNHGISIEVFPNASPEMLHTIVRALAHA